MHDNLSYRARRLMTYAPNYSLTDNTLEVVREHVGTPEPIWPDQILVVALKIDSDMELSNQTKTPQTNPSTPVTAGASISEQSATSTLTTPGIFSMMARFSVYARSARFSISGFEQVKSKAKASPKVMIKNKHKKLVTFILISP